ncbi:GAF domain-containing SpoIIE family protein phosphatase [Streptomyces sp. NPDC047108]|uniref:PP2C family protein-serine/threonine phosphatase n=1 Tax=Streptomyces sp. NPDC047108 TaxID=3155025 RepID=UPI0033D5E049
MADAAGRIVELNEAARRLDPTTVPGGHLHDTALSWLRPQTHPYPVAAGGGPERLTGRVRGRRPDDEPHLTVLAGSVDGRRFSARPSVLGGGRTAYWLTDDTEHLRVLEELRAERDRTQFLVEVSGRLLGSLNLDRCMELTASLAVQHLADAAVVIAPGAGRKLPLAMCDQHGTVRRATTTSAALDDVPGLAEALQGFPPVPSRWIDPSGAPSWLVPDGFGDPGAVAVTALPGHGVPAGAIVLLRNSRHAAFSEGEDKLVGLFAERAGAALSAARLYAEQTSLADTLMRELLPPAVHQVAGVEFAGRYRPSGDGERVGGDFYDVHPGTGPGEDETLAVLGDVCGKGLEAAVLTGKIRSTVQALLPLADDHQRMLRLLNNAMLSSHHTRYATLVLASARHVDGAVRLRLTSAGHPTPLIVRQDGTVEEAATHGTIVGALPEAPAHTVTTTLAPGETCLLFTDGITEARGGPMGGELFGDERLRRALAECAGAPATAVAERIQMLASEWAAADAPDDMAVIAITAPRTAGAPDGTGSGRPTP